MLQVLCLVGFFFGGEVWSTPTIMDIELKSLVLFLLTVVLIAYLILSVKKIVENNSNPHDLSLKNLLVTAVTFQVFLEIATLTNILANTFTTALLQLAFVLINTLLIGKHLTLKKDV